MSKYEIEMTDEAVQTFIHDLRELLGGTEACNVADIFEAQIPIPAPVKVGAVVMTEGDLNGGIYIRWTPGDMSASPWILARDHETPYRTDQIGRITEVLSPGVDL